MMIALRAFTFASFVPLRSISRLLRALRAFVVNLAKTPTLAGQTQNGRPGFPLGGRVGLWIE